MEHENIQKLIVKRGGYLTLNQLKVEFSDVDEEILDANLTFLVEKNRVRQITFQAPEGSCALYYIPRQ